MVLTELKVNILYSRESTKTVGRVCSECGQILQRAVKVDIMRLTSAKLNCHWEDCDTVAQEAFKNVSISPPLQVAEFTANHLLQDSLICVCVAFAIRTV